MIFIVLNTSKIDSCGIPQKSTSGVLIVSVGKSSEIERIDINNFTIHLNDCEDSKVYINKTISKEDLSLEWLEDNCETARCTACEDLECKNQKCDLYYCGDYFVEVKR